MTNLKVVIGTDHVGTHYADELIDSIPDIDFPMYLRLSEEGLFPLDKLVTTSYALEDAQTAIDDLENGKIAGRALLTF